jgi:hypothetical protein
LALIGDSAAAGRSGSRPEEMTSEVLRVTTFDTVELDDNDWDGPKPLGKLLTYKSKHDAAFIWGSSVVFDKDYPGGKTVTIDGNIIHLPEGAG